MCEFDLFQTNKKARQYRTTDDFFEIAERD